MFMLPSKFGFIVTGKFSETVHSGWDNPCTLFMATEFLEKKSDYGVQCSVNVNTIQNPDLEKFWH